MIRPGGLVAAGGRRLRRWVAAVLDLTERSGAEAAPAASGSRERAARETGEATGQARDEFLANLSHELRAPLNAQLLWVRLLRSGALDPATAERALETIEETLRLQSRLIDRLVDARRAPRGPGEEAASDHPEATRDPGSVTASHPDPGGCGGHPAV